MRKLIFFILLLPFLADAQKPDFIRTPNTGNTIVDWNLKAKTLIVPHGPTLGIFYSSQDTTGQIFLRQTPGDTSLYFRIGGLKWIKSFTTTDTANMFASYQKKLNGTGYLKFSGTTPSYLSPSSVLSDIGAAPAGGGILTYTHTMGYGLSGGNFNNSANITSIIDTTAIKSKVGFLTDYNNLSVRITTNTTNISTNTTNITNLQNRNINTGLGLSGGGNLSADLTLKADTTVLQTVLNFFPKGDTRYQKILTIQNANSFFAGPTSGSPAATTWRGMVAADLNNLTILNGIGAVNANFNIGVGSGTIGGNLNLGGQLLIGGGSGSTVSVSAAAATMKLTSTTGTNSATLRFINTGNNVGIGTETSAGGTLLSGAPAYSTVLFGSSTAGMYFGVNNVTRMFLDNSGNVNIPGLTASKPVFTDASKNLTNTGPSTSSNFIKGDGSFDATAYASATAPGTNGQVIFNNLGSFAANSGFNYKTGKLYLGTTKDPNGSFGNQIEVMKDTNTRVIGLRVDNPNGGNAAAIGIALGGDTTRFDIGGSRFHRYAQMTLYDTTYTALVGFKDLFFIGSGGAVSKGITIYPDLGDLRLSVSKPVTNGTNQFYPDFLLAQANGTVNYASPGIGMGSFTPNKGTFGRALTIQTPYTGGSGIELIKKGATSNIDIVGSIAGYADTLASNRIASIDIITNGVDRQSGLLSLNTYQAGVKKSIIINNANIYDASNNFFVKNSSMGVSGYVPYYTDNTNLVAPSGIYNNGTSIILGSTTQTITGNNEAFIIKGNAVGDFNGQIINNTNTGVTARAGIALMNGFGTKVAYNLYSHTHASFPDRHQIFNTNGDITLSTAGTIALTLNTDQTISPGAYATGVGGTDVLLVNHGGKVGTIAANYYAPLASPAFTGTPTAPTASMGTNTTQLATTAFVLANSAALGSNNAFTGNNTFLNFYSTSATPTGTLGVSTIVGTGATFSIVGNNQAGLITVTTGTSISGGGTLFQVQMSGSFNYPTSCLPVLTPANISSSNIVYITSSNTSTFFLNTITNLAPSTIYKWYYHNGGY